MKPKPDRADIAVVRNLTLQRLARAQRRATAELLQLYVLEGFLRRLVCSTHGDRFVLKGGVLMAAFALRRATRDIDLLALRTDNDPAVVEQLIAEVAGLSVSDGVVFLLDTVTTRLIRDDDFYPGVRLCKDGSTRPLAELCDETVRECALANHPAGKGDLGKSSRFFTGPLRKHDDEQAAAWFARPNQRTPALHIA